MEVSCPPLMLGSNELCSFGGYSNSSVLPDKQNSSLNLEDVNPTLLKLLIPSILVVISLVEY